ncbi:hypothetical protein ACHAO1_006094 [Botrytis cinerea]
MGKLEAENRLLVLKLGKSMEETKDIAGKLVEKDRELSVLIERHGKDKDQADGMNWAVGTSCELMDVLIVVKRKDFGDDPRKIGSSLSSENQTQGQIQAHKYFGTPDNNFMAVILILVRMNIDSYSI